MALISWNIGWVVIWQSFRYGPVTEFIHVYMLYIKSRINPNTDILSQANYRAMTDKYEKILSQNHTCPSSYVRLLTSYVVTWRARHTS